MTAGVQSFEPGAAYLPAPSANPCAQGKTDSKGTGTQSGDASDFQSEMDLQDAAPEPKSTGRPQKGSGKNAGKKQNALPNKELPNKNDASAAPVVATPAQAVEPQRHVLPITFAPLGPDETADDAAQSNNSLGEATQEAVSQDTVSQNVILVKEPLLPGPQPAIQNEVIPPKTEQNDVLEKNPAVPSQKLVEIPQPVASDTVTKASAPESPDPQGVPQADMQSATAPETIGLVVTNPIVTTPIATNQTPTGQPAAPSQP